MNRIKILLIFVVVILTSCHGQDYNFVSAFPEKGSLEYKTISYNAVEMDPLAIYPITEGFRICQLYKSDYHFVLMNNDMGEIVRFLRVGRGPEEFVDANYAGITGMSGDSLSLLIRDWTNGRLYRTSVNMHDGDTHSSLLRQYSTGMRAIYPLSNGRFLCNNDANRYFFDDNGTPVYLDGWDEEINEAIESSETYIPDNQTLEFFSRDSSELLIYSIDYPILYLHSMKDGTLLNRTCVMMQPEEFLKDDSCPIYFGGGGYVGDYIALLLCDDENEASHILVFDKNLKPLVSYDVPFVSTLKIEPNTGKALSLDYENELVYIFDLSQWL